MFPGCCPSVYSMLISTQMGFIDSETLLTIQIMPTLKVVVKKDYIHIYLNNEPKYSVAIQLPNLIRWEYTDKIIGFRLKELYLTEEAYKLKELLAGRMFFARVQDFYTPLQVLGKGSSAKVLLVRHKESQQFYAAKCVEKSEMSFQEVEINNKLNHPAFVKIKEVYQGETSYYLIMDVLSGKNLQTILKQHQCLSLDQTRQIMSALLQGIEHLHSKNIMHRDLKPENIVLEKGNNLTTLKIVDFGLATYSDLKKFIYPKCGTPGYVAPEIANLVDKNQVYDCKCDIFSAGAIFYRLITGRDVFPGTGFNYVLQLNKKCFVDLTYLHLKKLPSNVIESCIKYALQGTNFASNSIGMFKT